MTTPKWTIDTREQQDLCYRAARFNLMKRGVCWCGVEMLLGPLFWERQAPRALLPNIKHPHYKIRVKFFPMIASYSLLECSNGFVHKAYN